MAEPPPGTAIPGGGPAGSGEGAWRRDVSHLIFSALADGIVAVDEDGTIRTCNPAAERLFGRPAGELVGTPFGFPLVTNTSVEIDIITPGRRSRVVAMRVTTTTLEGQRLHIASLRDVTLRRQVEQELEAALEQQNIVVGVAAHELRGPLAAIGMLVETLRHGSATLDEERRADILDRITDRVTRLQTLVTKLLTASKIDAGTRRLPERLPVLEAIVERLGDLGGRAADVVVSCPAEVVAMVDRAELAQMFTNYLENAFVYGRPPIEVRVAASGGSVEVRVVDHGPGVPEAFVPELFERFSREPGVKRATEGSGLGLWIVRSLARANGGDAWYEPAEGGGACFCLRLRRPARKP